MQNFQLAKQHHPDLKIHQNQEEDGGSDIMTEVITAYETLMNKHNEHFWTNARDSRVALACEMYTIEELRGMHRVFDVYSFRVIFNSSSDCDNGQIHVATTDVKSEGKIITEENSTSDKINNGNQHHHLDPTPIVPLKAHPDDSISDLKRHIQSYYKDAWGLDGQRLDRDGLYLGWELVHCGNEPTDCASGDNDRNNGGDVSILSYHLFLHSYGIQEGDILHAVVRRRDKM